MAELVDAADLKSAGRIYREGSSPSSPTRIYEYLALARLFCYNDANDKN